MKVSDLVNQPGAGGVKGVPDVLNTPRARITYGKFKDQNGNFSLLAGAFSYQAVYHNDVWKDPVINKCSRIIESDYSDLNGSLCNNCDPHSEKAFSSSHPRSIGNTSDWKTQVDLHDALISIYFIKILAES
jgi:hypothetical protein